VQRLDRMRQPLQAVGGRRVGTGLVRQGVEFELRLLGEVHKCLCFCVLV
jgi:hypothetical protein